MTENELAKVIVDTCYRIHVGLGPGLFESVYEEILFYELNKHRYGSGDSKLFRWFGIEKEWSTAFGRI